MNRRSFVKKALAVLGITAIAPKLFADKPIEEPFDTEFLNKLANDPSIKRIEPIDFGDSYVLNSNSRIQTTYMSTEEMEKFKHNPNWVLVKGGK